MLRIFERFDKVARIYRYGSSANKTPTVVVLFFNRLLTLHSPFLIVASGHKPKETLILIEEKLPPVNRRVIVVCKGFRCLGYLDRKGVWREVIKNTVLKDVIGWSQMMF